MDDPQYKARRRTEIDLPRHDWFDATVPDQRSNQTSATGRFRMQVRQISLHEHFDDRLDTLFITGRRYKRDTGTLGTVRVWAEIGPQRLSQFPPRVVAAVGRYLPAAVMRGR